MDIQLTPESEELLRDLARQEGKDPAAVAGELVTLGLERQQRLAHKKREIGMMLDERWEDYQAGRSAPVDGEEVRREMKARTQAQRERR